MTIKQVLKELGLTDKEPDVYLALLKTPGIQPASIIAQKSGLNRITVYKTLMKLATLGLVTKTMRFGVQCFFAEEPEKTLERLLLKRQQEIDSLSQLMTTVMPEIKSLQKQELLIPKVRFYEGIEGVKRAYEDTLAEGKTIYAVEDVGEIPKELLGYLESNYVPRRKELGIFAHVITPKTPENEAFRKRDKTSLRETRFTKLTKKGVEIELNLYGNKVAFFSFRSEEAFAVILESSGISNTMRAIFDLCWSTAS